MPMVCIGHLVIRAKLIELLGRWFELRFLHSLTMGTCHIQPQKSDQSESKRQYFVLRLRASISEL